MPVRLNGTYYGTKDAATALGRSEGRIRQMVRAEEIRAVQISPHAWLIPEGEIKRLLSEREIVAAQ